MLQCQVNPASYKDVTPERGWALTLNQRGPFGSDTEGYLGMAFQADVTFQVQRNPWLDGKVVTEIKYGSPSARPEVFIPLVLR